MKIIKLFYSIKLAIFVVEYHLNFSRKILTLKCYSLPERFILNDLLLLLNIILFWIIYNLNSIHILNLILLKFSWELALLRFHHIWRLLLLKRLIFMRCLINDLFRCLIDSFLCWILIIRNSSLINIPFQNLFKLFILKWYLFIEFKSIN